MNKLKNAIAGQAVTNESAATRPFPQLLEHMKKQIALALPAHLSADRIARIALTAYRTNPALAKADPMSLFAAVLQASQLGLEIAQNGEAYLVPFRSGSTYEIQMIPGYRGLIKLARQSGEITAVSARIVHEHDQFEVCFGTTESVVHKPRVIGDRGRPVAAYCIAEFRSGGTAIELMSWDEIMKIKARSKAANNGPWVTDEHEMARKTVVRRAAKYWPLSAELSRAITLDERAAVGASQGITIESATHIDEPLAPTTTGDEPLALPLSGVFLNDVAAATSLEDLDYVRSASADADLSHDERDRIGEAIRAKATQFAAAGDDPR